MTEKEQKRRDALGLFYESVLKPDHQLRQCAHNQKCFFELMEWRSEILEYLEIRVADSDSVILGYLTFYIWKDEDGNLVKEIRDIYVMPDHRRQKVATKLLNSLITNFSVALRKFEVSGVVLKMKVTLC